MTASRDDDINQLIGFGWQHRALTVVLGKGLGASAHLDDHQFAWLRLPLSLLGNGDCLPFPIEMDPVQCLTDEKTTFDQDAWQDPQIPATMK